MRKKLTRKQEVIKRINSLREDNYYIVSKIEKGQKAIFECSKCKKKFDLSNSVEYGAAVEMFKKRNDMCVGCYYKKTGKLVY
ncbi:hypothetical protein LCGC14_2348870 [marine sediment metagenome]|uniref:Uncharacterized protein n=1 Tax=marine sediment metagenome TaxID=412755 RepID=A0A0F8VCH8_9ZZZZ